MSWSIGYDSNWNRDIGYNIPSICDHPSYGEEIDRGLGYVCGSEPYGGDEGCGLFFCGKHRSGYGLCQRCDAEDATEHFTPTPDTTEWITHKLTHESWSVWRDTNPSEVGLMKAELERRSAVNGSGGTP